MHFQQQLQLENMRRGEEEKGNSFELREVRAPSHRRVTGETPDYHHSSPYRSPTRALGNITQKLRASRLPVPTRLRRCNSSENLLDADTAFNRAMSRRRSSLELTGVQHLSKESPRRPSSASLVERRGMSNLVRCNSSDGSRIPRLSKPFREVISPQSKSDCSSPTPTDRLRQRLLGTPASDTSRNQPLGLCVAGGVRAKKLLGRSPSAQHNADLLMPRRAFKTKSASSRTCTASQPVVFGEKFSRKTTDQIETMSNETSQPLVQDRRTQFKSRSRGSLTSERGEDFHLRSLANQRDRRKSCSSVLSKDSDMTVVSSNTYSPSESQDSGFKSVVGAIIMGYSTSSEPRRKWCERSQGSSVSTESVVFSSVDDNDSIVWQDDNIDSPELSGSIFSPSVRSGSSRSHTTRSSYAEASDDLEQLMSTLLPQHLSKSLDSHINIRQSWTPYSRDQNMTDRHSLRRKSLNRMALKKQLTVEDEPIRAALEIKAKTSTCITPIEDQGVGAANVACVEDETSYLESPFASRLPQLQRSSYFKLKAAAAIREIKASGFTSDVEQRGLEDTELVVMDAEEHRRMIQELRLLKTMLLKLKRQLMNNKEDGIAVQQLGQPSNHAGERFSVEAASCRRGHRKSTVLAQSLQ